VPSAGALSACHKEDNVLSLNFAAASAAPVGATMTAAPTQVTSEELLAHILNQLEDDKAEEIVQIDLRGKTAIGDYMVICSGRSSRQVSAIAEKLVDDLKQTYGRLSRIEGKETGDWVLIDTGDVIVHVFRPEVREFYQLEKMWMPSGSAKPAAATTV
jgi:ribosome-associated protein